MTEKLRKANKTNSMRLLETRRVPYQVHRYAPEIHSAEGVAEVVGLPAERVFKTLVVLPTAPGRPLLAMIPGNAQLDLKALARAAGEKKLRMATQHEAESLTRLRVGGISALALMDKGFRIYLDESARRWETILVSAGERGTNLELPPDALIEVTGAAVATIVAAHP